MPPLMRQYSKDHTKTRSAKIDSINSYIFLTPEYNHGTSDVIAWGGALKTLREAQ